jgi:hypothetical protein
MFGRILDALASCADALSDTFSAVDSSSGSDDIGGIHDCSSAGLGSSDDDCRFDNAFGTACDCQVPAEASSAFPASDLTTSTYGAFESTSADSFGSSWETGGSSGWD